MNAGALTMINLSVRVAHRDGAATFAQLNNVALRIAPVTLAVSVTCATVHSLPWQEDILSLQSSGAMMTDSKMGM